MLTQWFSQATVVDWLTLVCAAVWALVKVGEWKRGVERRRAGPDPSAITRDQLELRLTQALERHRHDIRDILNVEQGRFVTRDTYVAEHRATIERLERLERIDDHGAGPARGIRVRD